MKRFAVPLLLSLVLAACGDDGTTGTGAGGPTKVTVKTQEYAFDVPASFKGGLVELTLDNSAGKEAHEAELTRLEEGKTLDDFRQAAQAQGPPPPWAKAAGGPGPVLPGKSATYTVNLDPGKYVLVCHVPAPDGKPHLEKGMMGETEVTAGTTGTLPSGDVTVTMDEFKFGGTDGLKAGSQVVKVTNAGQQPHHIAMLAMQPGKGPQDLAAFFSNPQGPPPFSGLPGLVATTPPGGEATRTLELEAGTKYVLVCFIPDKDGTPHMQKGMLAEVTPA